VTGKSTCSNRDDSAVRLARSRTNLDESTQCPSFSFAFLARARLPAVARSVAKPLYLVPFCCGCSHKGKQDVTTCSAEWYTCVAARSAARPGNWTGAGCWVQMLQDMHFARASALCEARVFGQCVWGADCETSVSLNGSFCSGSYVHNCAFSALLRDIIFLLGKERHQCSE
jgi:hypothetical protein